MLVVEIEQVIEAVADLYSNTDELLNIRDSLQDNWIEYENRLKDYEELTGKKWKKINKPIGSNVSSDEIESIIDTAHSVISKVNSFINFLDKFSLESEIAGALDQNP